MVPLKYPTTWPKMENLIVKSLVHTLHPQERECLTKCTIGKAGWKRGVKIFLHIPVCRMSNLTHFLPWWEKGEERVTLLVFGRDTTKPSPNQKGWKWKIFTNILLCVSGFLSHNTHTHRKWEVAGKKMLTVSKSILFFLRESPLLVGNSTMELRKGLKWEQRWKTTTHCTAQIKSC